MGIKYSVNENFFKTWSQEMAYVLGYIFADGSLEDASYIRGKYVRISSVELGSIEKIKTWMCSKHKIAERKSLSEKRKSLYLLRIGSRRVYEDLLKLGLHPNKSLTMKFPDVPKKFIPHFIRGYFDGDGCVRIWMTKGKTQEMILRKLCTVFTCGSKEFLEELANCISKNIGTKQLNVYNSRRSFMLSYSTSDSVKIFCYIYKNVESGIYLKRKAEIYKQYFKLRPKRLDKKVKSVLECISE